MVEQNHHSIDLLEKLEALKQPYTSQEDSNIQGLMKADQDIDQTFLTITQRLQYYLDQQFELSDEIEALNHQIQHRSDTGKKEDLFLKQRFKAKHNQKSIIDRQVATMDGYLSQMVEGSSKFKEKRDLILEEYYSKKQKEQQKKMQFNGLTPSGDTPMGEDYETEEAREKLEIQQEMIELDNQIRQIDSYMSKDFSIDDRILQVYENTGIFNQYDASIVNAPYQDYNEDNLPDYYPKDGLLINKISLIGTGTQQEQLTEEQNEELKQYEESQQKEKKRKQLEIQQEQNIIKQSFGRKFLNLFNSKKQ
eukprot:403352248